MTIQLQHVPCIDRIRESLNVVSIFVRFIYGPLVCHAVANVQLAHQFADNAHATRDFTDCRVLLTQTLNAEETTLT